MSAPARRVRPGNVDPEYRVALLRGVPGDFVQVAFSDDLELVRDTAARLLPWALYRQEREQWTVKELREIAGQG